MPGPGCNGFRRGCAPGLPRRRRAAHKGRLWPALLLGGAEPYPGAIVLAAAGALRSGAGLVRVAASAPAAAAVAARVPEAMSAGLDPPMSRSAGRMPFWPGPAWGAIRKPAGWWRGCCARLLVRWCSMRMPSRARGQARSRAGLSAAGGADTSSRRTRASARHGCGGHPEDRLAAVREAAERTGAVVVLKGAGTLVAKGGSRSGSISTAIREWPAGGAATCWPDCWPGSWRRSIDPLAAACAAVWLHGTAGDVAALKKTQAAMKAGDIARCLPAAFRQAGLR
jgi:ADP-dependent NAD(P)H-hydrate dehydratase / NAD(P)H-hydrate epimerase